MQEFKGTPGPWERDQFGNVVHGPVDGWGRKESVRVSGVALPGRVTPEYEANTHLVAAAPELLSALDLILNYHDDGNCVLHREDVSRARAAIKKALGQ